LSAVADKPIQRLYARLNSPARPPDEVTGALKQQAGANVPEPADALYEVAKPIVLYEPAGGA
jgi:hypothetical protein